MSCDICQCHNQESEQWISSVIGLWQHRVLRYKCIRKQVNKQGKKETGGAECYVLGCFEVNCFKPVSKTTPQSQHVIHPFLWPADAD